MRTQKPERNEAATVCAAREGDKQALAELMQANWPWLKGLAYNILGHPDDVDEALQEICVLVISKISTLREPERFRPWLATVARHAALAFRARRSRRPVPLDDATAAGQRDTRTKDTLETLALAEEHRRILDALALLPDKYREVFIKRIS